MSFVIYSTNYDINQSGINRYKEVETTFILSLILVYLKCQNYPLARLKESPQNLFQFYSNLNYQSVGGGQQHRSNSRHKRLQIDYKSSDLTTINQFVSTLKQLDGDWSRHGLQRLVRLNSACSNSYVTLRNSHIKAEVPYEEAFNDPYSMGFLGLFLIEF